MNKRTITCKLFGLKLNTCKIKYIIINKQRDAQDNGVQIDGTNLESVNKLNFNRNLKGTIEPKFYSYKQTSGGRSNFSKNVGNIQLRAKQRSTNKDAFSCTIKRSKSMVSHRYAIWISGSL